LEIQALALEQVLRHRAELPMRRVSTVSAFVLLLLAGCQIVLGIDPSREAHDPPDGAADAVADPDVKAGDGSVTVDGATSDAHDAGADGHIDAADAADAAWVWPGCNPTTAFDTITPLSEINTTDWEVSARASSDELTLYYTRAPANPPNGGSVGLDYADLYVMTRATKNDPFSGETLLDPPTQVGVKGDLDPFVSADGLTLYFDSYRNGPRAVFVSTRGTMADPWGSPGVVSLGTGYEELEPYANGDGTALWFAAPKPRPGDPGNMNMFRATLAGGAVTAVAFSDLDTVAGERSPVVSEDERVVYFSHNAPNSGDWNIYVATRSDPSKPFGPPQLVTELASVSYDAPTWVSRDLCTIYFTSERASGLGGRDMYVAHRSK
jgi:hypothetical protein